MSVEAESSTVIQSNKPSSSPKWISVLETLGPLLALAIVVCGFAIADKIWGSGQFTDIRNLRVVLVMTAPVAVAALGMTLVIISGGIDLSAGTASMLSATVLACSLNAGFPIGVSIAFALAAGAACGVTNGLLIGLLRIPPFIVTLGTMTIFLGIAKYIAENWGGASSVTVNRDRIPKWLSHLTSTSPPDWYGWFPNIASGVWLALFLAAIVATLLHLTVFGRHVFAIGSSEPTARLCGVNIQRTKLLVYATAGVLIAIAGIYSVALVKVANPSDGIGKELRFIAAVVIGGASLSGGRGAVLGTLAGATIMGVITNGCDLLGIENSTQDIMIGIIIIVAVTLDQARKRWQDSN